MPLVSKTLASLEGVGMRSPRTPSPGRNQGGAV